MVRKAQLHIPDMNVYPPAAQIGLPGADGPERFVLVVSLTALRRFEDQSRGHLVHQEGL
jgi:hypothetical protein